MLFSPTYKTSFTKFFNDSVRSLAFASHPILSSIKVFQMPYEGSLATQVPSGFVKTPLGASEMTWTMSISDSLSTKIEPIQNSIIDAADQLVRSIVPSIFETMSAICTASGNSVNANAHELTVDHLLEVYEKIQFDFDELGRPLNFKLYINPIDADRIKNLVWTEEQKERHQDLMKQKYEEFLARKRNRKLY